MEKSSAYDRSRTAVPVPFAVLLDEISSDEKMVYEAVCSLLEKKQKGGELDLEPKLPVLDAFIETELSKFTETASGFRKIPASVEPLNELFREVVMEKILYDKYDQSGRRPQPICLSSISCFFQQLRSKALKEAG